MAATIPSGTSGIHIVATGCLTVAAWSALAVRSHTISSPPLGWMLATMVVTWTALVWTMKKIPPRETAAVLGFALGFRLIAFFAAPIMEDDHPRFLWDGYRFATTGNPYVEAPAARFADETIPAEFRAVLDRINHPDVPTVYGPLTQWAFRLSHAIAPAQLWPWKLILLGADLTILALLWPLLSARGQLLLAWCPLAIFETGFNAHPDVLAIALVVIAWRLALKSLPLAAGAVAGFAVAAKIFGLLPVPFVLWHLRRRAWAIAATTAAVLSLHAPFWLHGSTADLAGLRAMATEWEFNSSVFAVVAEFTSRNAAQVTCALAFGIIWLALLVSWARTKSVALPPGEWIYGALLLLSATVNPWYCLWLWPFVATRPSATGGCALAAVSLAYVTGLNLCDATLGNFEHPWWLRPLEFGLVACGALWDWRNRKKSAREHSSRTQEQIAQNDERVVRTGMAG
jgi:alpha-1,6-mannosyltransferase